MIAVYQHRQYFYRAECAFAPLCMVDYAKSRSHAHRCEAGDMAFQSDDVSRVGRVLGEGANDEKDGICKEV